MFNNSDRYQHLENILRKLAGETVEDGPVEPLVPVSEWEAPLWNKIAPALDIFLRSGVIMIGNDSLPTIAVFFFRYSFLDHQFGQRRVHNWAGHASQS